MTKTVAAAEAKEHFDEMLEEVAETGEEVLVMKDGKAVAMVVPARSLEERRRASLEELRGSVRILGDIMEPLDEDEWDCMK